MCVCAELGSSALQVLVPVNTLVALLLVFLCVVGAALLGGAFATQVSVGPSVLFCPPFHRVLALVRVGGG